MPLDFLHLQPRCLAHYVCFEATPRYTPVFASSTKIGRVLSVHRTLLVTPDTMVRKNNFPELSRMTLFLINKFLNHYDSKGMFVTAIPADNTEVNQGDVSLAGTHHI